MPATSSRVSQWARRADPILTVAALVFLLAWAVPIVWPTLPRRVVAACDVVAWLVWGAFAVDYVVRLLLADDRRRHVRSHLLDLLVIVLPLLRPLRLLRLVTMLRFIDANAASRLTGRIATYVIGGASLLCLVGALAALEAERDSPRATITTFPDALWWAFTTMTTVGYGDYSPVTLTGRLVAVGLMMGGIALVSTVTATIASWLVDRLRAEQAASRRDLPDA